MTRRRINQTGLDLIKQWEGLRLRAYTCPAGKLTIGYGSTGPHVRAGMVITEEEAEQLLKDDLDRFERVVQDKVTVPLTDNQFAALVSFAFNVGTGAFQRSTLLRKLNAGGYDAVPEQLARWVHAGGRRLQGLANRRAAEAGLWARGAYVSSNHETPDVSDKASKTAKADISGVTLIGAGALGEAVNQLTPFADNMPMVSNIVVLLILAGVALTAYTSIRKVWEDR